MQQTVKLEVLNQFGQPEAEFTLTFEPKDLVFAGIMVDTVLALEPSEPVEVGIRAAVHEYVRRCLLEPVGADLRRVTLSSEVGG